MARSRTKASPTQTERLILVEAKLETFEQATTANFQGLAQKLEQLNTCIDRVESRIEASLHGEKADPGLVVRIDRLEQSHERTRWLTRAIVGAVVTIAVGAIWALLR